MNDSILAVLPTPTDSRQFCGIISGSLDFQKNGGGVKTAMNFCNYVTCKMIW